MSGQESEIARLRAAIDSFDEQIVRLLNERATCVLGMRRQKNDAGLDQFDPDREAEIYLRLAQANEGPLRDSDLQRIYETLLDVMKTFE